MQDHTMDDSEPAFYSHNAQYLHSPPNSHPSPQGTNGLLSPPCRPEFDQSNKVSQDFVLDCLRFQTQLLNRLNTLDQDPNYLDQPQYNANNSSIPQMMDGMTREPMNCMGTFTPSAAQINNIDFSFDSPRDDWRTEAFGLKTRQSPSPIGTMSVPQLPDAAIPTLEPMLDAGVLSRSTRASSAPSRTDERLENVMRHAHAAGFDTFEDMATSYYQTTFKNSSPLSTEQHLSRSKRLPRVISSVYQASESWPHWERHGFRDEIVKTATTMLGSEASEKSATLSSNLSPLLENLKTKDASKIAATLETIKQTIQQELPHSWALNSGLAKEMGAGWQANDGNAAMATIMLQQLSGKIPKEQLLRVVEACL
ncbi:hypothetical protein QQS21_009580 [Conoideocrella luteorostrata]|uniref:Uncharacterized protein n=1 Tax=Conoideocrella luteorostrata TaxID=1105319 RepID=A0AAJ0FQ97_9HYPO|nr:hypothetical protein QQS21_009580 [Conoideocrella luteorostrata]